MANAPKKWITGCRLAFLMITSASLRLLVSMPPTPVSATVNIFQLYANNNIHIYPLSIGDECNVSDFLEASMIKKILIKDFLNAFIYIYI